MKFEYLTNCVNSGDGASVTEMVECAREVTLRTLRRHCDIRDFEQGAGYDTGHERGGLRMKDDWAVGYFKSVFQGRSRRCTQPLTAARHGWMSRPSKLLPPNVWLHSEGPPFTLASCTRGGGEPCDTCATAKASTECRAVVLRGDCPLGR